MHRVKLLFVSTFVKKIIYCAYIIMMMVIINSACARKLSAPTLSNEIENIQHILMTQQDATLDIANAQMLIDKSMTYVARFPQDTLAPVYLFRAADVARGIGQYDLAVTLWGQVQEQYIDFEKVPDALFMQGFTFDNNLQDKSQARSCYQRFIQLFPKHHLLTTVNISLQQLSKTPEELIKEFQKNR